MPDDLYGGSDKMFHLLANALSSLCSSSFAMAFATEMKVSIEPLPCWCGLEPGDVQHRVEDLIDEIVEEAAAKRKAKSIRCLGVKAIKARHPHSRPEELKESHAPDFHAASDEAFKKLKDEYDDIVCRYRLACVDLMLGQVPSFPRGGFPPALPYVPYARGQPCARGQPSS